LLLIDRTGKRHATAGRNNGSEIGIVDTVNDKVAGFFRRDDKKPAKHVLAKGAGAKKVASKKAAKRTPGKEVTRR
jgi:hypothetical protein